MSDAQLTVISNYLYIYLGFFLGFTGSVGNLLTISTFLFIKKYRSLTSSIFLAGSAFGEQLFLLSCAFPEALTPLLRYDFYSISNSMCKSTSFFYFCGAFIALTCMYMAGIERYLQTCRSTTLREWMTVLRCRLLVVIIILVSSGLSMPFILYRNVTDTNLLCEYTNSTFKRMASLMYAIIGVPLPIMLLGIFGFLTWRNLKTTSQRTIFTNNRTNHQVVRMMLIQTSIVVSSVFPACLLQAIFLITNKGTLGITALDKLLVCIGQLLLYSHSCTSFYVYLLVSPTFRRNAKVILCWNHIFSTRIVPFTQQTNTIRMQAFVT